MLIFLRTVRATIIAGVALPLSLIATFGIMWFCGFSLDNLSLMALTIGTGFVVDDAIVMIENIVRHMEDGEDPFEAALDGASEIGFTVISLTVSLIAVFIPLLFMTGLVGRMFREFALTLTIAVVTSAVVSLTLTPMMCSRLLRHASTEAPRGHIVTRISPPASTDRWNSTGAASNGCCATKPSRFWSRPPRWSRRSGSTSSFRRASCRCRTPASSIAVMEGGQEVSFAEMQRLQATVETAIRKDPDVTGVVSVIGVTPMNATPNAGRLAITLRSRDERKTPVTTDHRPAAAGGRHGPGRGGLLPAGAGHPDFDAHEPRAISVHAHRHRRARRSTIGPSKLAQKLQLVADHAATSPRRRRTTASA